MQPEIIKSGNLGEEEWPELPFLDGQNGLPLFEQCLEAFLKGRICIFGVGNRYRRDDGVGSLIAELIQTERCFDVIDAGSVPENHLERVVSTSPDTILVIDATDFGGKPGQVRLLYPNHVAWSGLSTHAGSLQLLANYLQARTQAQIALLAIQPADMGEGEGLSNEVARTANILLECLPKIVGASLARDNRPIKFQATSAANPS